jgi:hypothetical protein
MQGKRPAKPPIPYVRSAVAIWRLRSIQPSPCVVVMKNTDRMKVLQMTILSTMRAMRSVFCWVLRHGSSSNPLARSSPDHRGAFQAALNAFVAEERALGDLGPNEMVQAFKTASTHIESRPIGPLREARGRNSRLPPRCRRLRAGRGCGSGGSTKVVVRWDTGSSQEDRFFPPLLREEVAAVSFPYGSVAQGAGYRWAVRNSR